MIEDKPSIEAVFAHYGVDVVGLHGNRLVKCPAHDESHPSCSVNLDKGVAYCHACQFSGDVFNLIMLKEGIDFAAAQQFATDHFAFVRKPPPGGRTGLDGRSSGGYRPKVRRRGLAG